MESMKNNLVTKKDLFQASYRWLLASQICWNYERMMSTGYLYTMLPFLKKKYGHDENQLKEIMETHNQFFNTNPMVGHIILGIDMAIEEQEGMEAKEVITGIKAGLMGPFAGVGDTIFGVLIPTICGSIAAYMGRQGNVTGVIIWVLVNVAVIVGRMFLMPFGYRQGLKLVNEFSDKLNALTDAAILLGITVVGALIPTVVTADVSFVYQSGEVELELQEILDQIMPALIPAALVGLVYWLLGRKKMSSTKAILLVMLLSILLYNLNILE
ncbi:PTS fructose transporter subunit IID [Tetragenococcus osmophilus]|nr:MULTISPECIES: PTS system mannose/fructose/sorbose family transporter subunit IID [Tetragenococcus]AYW47268.1 PTS fructose transporter subunit IID [Tetragenococcus osmophilus]GMA52794.1 PTS fructose transporter subunit IID [Alicyclobacillus contaminans]GMA73207.1 PTS fructose transporter subunit IID [Tetragenococcus osmophilus]